MLIAIDFGISNTDIVVNDNGECKFFSHPTIEKINERFLEKIFSYIDIPADKFSLIGVTGGKSSDLSDEYHNVKVLKVNEVDAIAMGAKSIFKINDDLPYIAVSAGTGTACIYNDNGVTTHLGGISVGGGTLQGLSKKLLNEDSSATLEKLSLAGNRTNLDSLIGEVVNDIGSLHPGVTASNFEKAKYSDDHSNGDIAASLSNMVGEIIGTISYLNALLMGVSEVFFIGRVANLEVVRTGITDRLALANIKGNFDSQSGFGNALGVMFFLNKES